MLLLHLKYFERLISIRTSHNSAVVTKNEQKWVISLNTPEQNVQNVQIKI
jgi:hypothetical protein